MGEDGGTGERRYFLESRKYQRTCVVNGKAAGFKLGVALATCRPAPVAGESLNRPDASKLSSVRFLLSPFVSPSSLLHFAKFVHTRREDCTLRRGKRGIIIYA